MPTPNPRIKRVGDPVEDASIAHARPVPSKINALGLVTIDSQMGRKFEYKSVVSKGMSACWLYEPCKRKRARIAFRPDQWCARVRVVGSDKHSPHEIHRSRWHVSRRYEHAYATSTAGRLVDKYASRDGATRR